MYKEARFGKTVHVLYQSLAWECKVGLGRPTTSTTATVSSLPPGIYWPASGGSREIVRKRLSYGTRGTGVLFGLVGALAEQSRVVLLWVRKPTLSNPM